jgi:Ankyrin repeats (3 copies)
LKQGSSLPSGQTPLTQAARNGNYAVVKLLIEKGAKLEVRDTDGRTPLSWAIKNGHETIMKLLEKSGNSAEPRRPPSPTARPSTTPLSTARPSSARPSSARPLSARPPSSPRPSSRSRRGYYWKLDEARPRSIAREVLPTVNESEPLPPR